jgi:hypothetical protein
MFARYSSPDDTWTPPTPTGQLALLLDEVSGADRRCPGATPDQKIGLLQTWAAIESWAAAGKLGVIRDIMRDEAPPSPGADHGDLPETWSRSLRYELSGALACSAQSAETTAQLAWQLGARLPAIARELDKGTITAPKARAITETLSQLTDPDAAAAEAMIADQLAGKTYTQILRLTEQAALTIDPALAERWRKHAQKNDARVTFFREPAGTAGLSGRDLPPDEALAAMAHVNARAEQYKESDAFDDTPMDVLRARAYLDLINGITAATRITLTEQQNNDAPEAWPDHQPQPAAEDSDDDPRTDDPGDDDPEPGTPGTPDSNGPGGPGPGGPRPGGPVPSGPTSNHPSPGGPASSGPASNGPDPGDPGPGALASGGPGGADPDAGSPQPGGAPTGQARERRPADLIVPLKTLLGLAERPGEIHGFGLLDPALARDLAAAAAANPRTEVCVTVTSPEGYAIAHGCARPARSSHKPGPAASAIALPARLNLTIPATLLLSLSSRAGPWSFTPRGRPETQDDYGIWTLILPGGREFNLRLDPVPVFACDHRYETHHYQPSDRLRHLVQIRDGTCTFPTCNRHARDSDFEHALPYDKGGKTCACNAGARSRACHQVKQSPGWNVTQPQPGWHRWQTPAGRVYTQEPKRYLS